MTDLENAWDDLPVSTAPIDAVLRAGRRDEPRRRPVPRPGLRTATAFGAVAAAFVAGVVVADPGGSGGDVPSAASGPASGAGAGGQAGAGPIDAESLAITPAAFHGELQAPTSCGALLEHYQDRAEDLRIGPVGLRDRSDLPRPLPALSAPALDSAELVGTTGSYASDTGTTVQEAGVDEPDAVKTDGDLLVRIRGSELTTYDVGGPEVEELASLDLDDLHDGELLLAGDTVVVIGNDGSPPRYDAAGLPLGSFPRTTTPAVPEQTRVVTVDVTDPAAPREVRTVDYDAGLITARQHGEAIRLVLRKGVPDLGLGRRARRVAEQRIAATTLDDWLPRVSVDGGEDRRLLECDRVAVPRADTGLVTMAVVGFDAGTADGGAGADPTAGLDTLGLAGEASMAYESTDHLYLAANDADYSAGTTHVYDFALDGRGASYVGAGEAEGTLRDRWSMDETDGVLRLALGASSETGNWNSIVTMRARGDELVELGRLERLGVGEDITAVRWFDGLALLVTFRQIDPLYAVDLTDARTPRLIGELKIPGFSSYLHPLGTQRLVGVGEGPQPSGGWGAQLGLFDVTDLTSPDRLDVVSYGPRSRALAGRDPRQLTWLPQQRVVLSVITRGRAVYVSRLQLGAGRMRNEMTRVEWGSDADVVRLVPVVGDDSAGGAIGGQVPRAVLVTGEDVRFFDVD